MSMTAKEWLNRGRLLDKEINALIQAKENAYEDACRITANYSDDVRVQSSPRNAQETRLVNLADYERMINDEIDALYDIKQEIFRAVMAVPDPKHRTLLLERYVNLKTWEQIAVDMKYSYHYVNKDLHEAALADFQIPRTTPCASVL